MCAVRAAPAGVQAAEVRVRRRGRGAHAVGKCGRSAFELLMLPEGNLACFQRKVDEITEKWEVPPLVPFGRPDVAKAALDTR
jgi:hypothetical protein